MNGNTDAEILLESCTYIRLPQLLRGDHMYGGNAFLPSAVAGLSGTTLGSFTAIHSLQISSESNTKILGQPSVLRQDRAILLCPPPPKQCRLR